MSHSQLAPAVVAGVDIGGTKTAVVRWSRRDGFDEVARFPTAEPAATLARVEHELAALRLPRAAVVGVACGGPLDAPSGRIQAPPNLPGWDDVPVVRRLARSTRRRVFLMNDANANALAEWRFGAGRRSRIMVFLTAGTGLGAGIVIDGRVLDGACGNAGEIGHVRLTPAGPRGFHKPGSVEGWCSGGGIPQIVRFLPPAQRPRGIEAWCRRHPTTATIAAAARERERAAQRVFAVAGEKLGQMLALLIDVLNPDRVVLGSLYVRCRDLLDPSMWPVLRREALPASLAACEIVPASLGERAGGFGAVCAGLAGCGKLASKS